ncbi:O-antigen ligase family protein [bacterium]|nr:O-antigen ligase family protein [bacterium]
MRRKIKSTPDESIYQRAGRWVLTLTFGVLALVFWPTANNANLAKPVLLVAGLIAINFLLFARYARGEHIHLGYSAIDLCVGIYTLVLCTSWIYSDYRSQTVIAMRSGILYAMLYFTTRLILTDERTRAKLIYTLLLGCTAVSLAGIYERLGGLPWGNMSAVSSTWFNPTYLAAYLLTVMPLAAWAAFEKRHPFRSAGIAALLTGAPALLFTSTVIAWVGVVPILLVALVGAWPLLAADKKKKLAEFAVACVVLIGAYQFASLHWCPTLSPTGVIARAFSASDASNSERLGLMTTALHIGCCSPILGKGAGTFGIYAPQNAPHSCYANILRDPSVNGPVIIAHAHNEFLEVFAELGIIGLVAFLSMPIAAAWAILVLQKQKDVSLNDKRLAIALLAGMVGFLAANMVGRSARVPGETAYYYILLAVLASMHAQSEFWRPVRKSKRTFLLAAISAVCALLLIIGWSSLTELRSSIYLTRGEALLTDPYNTAGSAAAAEEFKIACRLTPFDPGACYELGNALAVSGRHYEALDAYKVVEKLSPDYGRVHFNKATSLYNLGRYIEAEREMTIAHEQDGLPDSRARLDYLRSLFHKNSR